MKINAFEIDRKARAQARREALMDGDIRTRVIGDKTKYNRKKEKRVDYE